MLRIISNIVFLFNKTISSSSTIRVCLRRKGFLAYLCDKVYITKKLRFPLKHGFFAGKFIIVKLF